ncbi:MAG: hypothetical protein LPK79_14440 [Bacteroidota bacterium]|nr:hypothetical protein [Bacteroidota bacterium]
MFFSTIESQFRNFNQLRLTVPVIARIHNANTFLRRTFHYDLKLNPYWLFKDLSYIIRKVLLEREILERKKFIDRCQGICFTSDEITFHVRNNDSYRNRDRIIDAIPITFNEWEPPQKMAKPDSIAIVGTIDRKRKNYPQFLRALGSIGERLTNTLTIRFMGRPKGSFGHRILDKAKGLQNDNLRIKTWKDGLSQDDFDTEMNQVDLLVAPIFQYTKYFLTREEYGRTKISGSINDCIKYARPGIIPHFYPVPKGTESIFLKYHDEKELEKILWEITRGEKSISLEPDILRPFRLEAVRRKALSILENFYQSLEKSE